MSGEARRRLTSWKEIATHLRREVRTVIRWEKERGLPVHRIPGGQGRSVFAFTDELDRWAAGELQAQQAREAQPEPDSRPTLRAWRVIAALAAGILGVGVIAARVVTAWPTPQITDLRLDGDTLTAIAGTRTLWSFRVPHAIIERPYRRIALTDVDGDGRVDAIASVDLSTSDLESSAALYAIDSRGRLSWTASIAEPLSFGAGRYDPPWQPDDVGAFTSHGQPRITWALHHYIWWPSMLAVFDGKGARIGTFVNAGWIRAGRATADGRYLIAGAFSNSRDAAAFAVLDADHPSGSSPEDDSSPYACRNCPTGRPLRYITIQWTDLAASRMPGEQDVTVIATPDGGVVLHAMQRRKTEAIVELSPSLTIVRAEFSDNYWDVHRELEEAGTVKHSRATCPFRNGPVVREWTPESGWRDVRP